MPPVDTVINCINGAETACPSGSPEHTPCDSCYSVFSFKCKGLRNIICHFAFCFFFNIVRVYSKS